MTEITIKLNNHPVNLIAPISLSELISVKAPDETGTAIALNSVIVSKKNWPNTFLGDGDIVDIFTLVAGG